MCRKENFLKLKDHAYYHKHFKKLTSSELDFCLMFIDAFEDNSRDKYSMRVNRIGVDDKFKMKNRHLIAELLLASMD